MSKREYHPYYIPRRNTRCVKCQELFQPGAAYYSILIETLEGVVKREDYCLCCWNPEDKPRDLFWQGKIPVSAAAIVNDAARIERALELLRQYSAGEDPLEKAQAYVLALYLERRKAAVMRKELWEGTQVAAMLYEVNETGELIAVPRVQLDGDDIEKVQGLVAEQLGTQNVK